MKLHPRWKALITEPLLLQMTAHQLLKDSRIGFCSASRKQKKETGPV